MTAAFQHSGRGPDADVIVVGGGNAAICAAIAAREAGASVLLLEKETCERRGGNSQYARNLRVASDAYPEEELLGDLAGVTGEGIDLELGRFTAAASRELPGWMEAQGVRWQPALSGTLSLDRTNRFFLGGGKALLNAYYRRAERLAIDVRYGVPVEALELVADHRGLRSVRVGGAKPATLSGRAIVAAAGGFEANLERLARDWGDAAANFVVRGTRANDGHVLDRLLAAGAAACGNPTGFHAIAVDARSPRFEGGIVTRIDSIPLGIVVNREGLRFHDEGEDLWPKRYASWGQLIARQPGQLAYSIYDARVAGTFIPPVYPPLAAPTLAELATGLGLEPARLEATVGEYNGCVRAGAYDRARLDGCRTAGLSPAKSHWALPIDTPPYFGYRLRPGITFTYHGVAADRRAQVMSAAGGVLDGVFAAGEIMAGSILREGYLAGFGMTIGTVFGRIAGTEAARVARAG